MYLELAEGENNGNYQALAETPGGNYVFIPGGFLPNFAADTYVRADYFASNYDADTAYQILNALAPYQKETMSEGLISTALQFIPGAGPIASKGLDFAKNLIAKRQAAVAAGTAKPIGKPGGFLDKLRGKLTGGTAAPAPAPAPAAQDQQKDLQVGFNLQTQQQGEAKPTFWQKNKTPILIGGAALAIVGTLLIVTRKKRR